MRKKEYERPTMQVVELKQQLALLAGSNAATTENYNWNNVDPE